MEEYKVTIKEILKTTLRVRSHTIENAKDWVKKMYDDESIVLTADDYFETIFEVEEIEQPEEELYCNFTRIEHRDEQSNEDYSTWDLVSITNIPRYVVYNSTCYAETEDDCSIPIKTFRKE